MRTFLNKLRLLALLVLIICLLVVALFLPGLFAIMWTATGHGSPWWLSMAFGNLVATLLILRYQRRIICWLEGVLRSEEKRPGPPGDPDRIPWGVMHTFRKITPGNEGV